jgi:arylsulfatase A-like enzyme
MHGFDEFLGNLYHLNAEEEPEDPDYPKNPEFKKFGPRGVLRQKPAAFNLDEIMQKLVDPLCQDRCRIRK